MSNPNKANTTIPSLEQAPVPSQTLKPSDQGHTTVQDRNRGVTKDTQIPQGRFSPEGNFLDSASEKREQGESLDLMQLIAGLINEKAGSSFVTPVFGEMVFHQLSDLVIAKQDMDKFISTSVDRTCKMEMLSTFIAKINILLESIKPKDQLEGMLAVQMIGIHHAAMKVLNQAHHSNDLEHRLGLLNMAGKLTRTFTQQMEALNRNRGKGQQKMTVEHVNVNAGGQAIIGQVHKKAGGQRKRNGKK